ncbi:hypothetical protein BCI9360_02792 [Bacillus sp. CECT 9360]|nr:hypothetical protein BCI9360_02792 [Bacillus sp. CECT 9360]
MLWDTRTGTLRRPSSIVWCEDGLNAHFLINLFNNVKCLMIGHVLTRVLSLDIYFMLFISNHSSK